MKHPKKLRKLLEKLKSLPVDSSEVTVQVFFARRYTNRSQLSVSLFSVTALEGLEGEIRRIVKRRIGKANNVEKYEPETSDHDDGLLVATTEESHWKDIGDKILNNRIKPASSAEDIKGADLLIADFIFRDNTRLFSVTKLPEKLTNRRLGMKGILFTQGKIDLLNERQKVLPITLRSDFFVYEGNVFVANKVDFERAMNIREGMIRKRDALITAVENSKKFKGTEYLKEHIKDNMTLLRRAAKAANSGNLEKSHFFVKLNALIAQYPQFDVTTDNGVIVITEKNAGTVLYLLNDARAETLINRQLIDVTSGTPVPNGTKS